MLRRVALVGLALGIVWVHGQTRADGSQIVVDRVAAWASSTLRADLPSRPVRTDAGLRLSAVRVFDGGVGEIVLSAGVARDLAPLERGSRNAGTASALHVALHEVLHRTWADPWVEEGVVEAVSADLAPALTRALLGRAEWTGNGYPSEVAAVRAASARATGSRCWRAPEAARWRRALLLADDTARGAMLARAETEGERWSSTARRAGDRKARCTDPRATGPRSWSRTPTARSRASSTGR